MEKSCHESVDQVVKFEFEDRKPVGRGPIDNEALFEMMDERDLLNHDWTANDRAIVANLIIGKHYMFMPKKPVECAKLTMFQRKLTTEMEKDATLRAMMDPVYLLICSLPTQKVNGPPYFSYPRWPPAYRASPITQTVGFEATACNCPSEWHNWETHTGLLYDVQLSLHNHRANTSVASSTPPVLGETNAAFALTGGNPFLLTFNNEEDCSIALDAMKDALHRVFANMEGFSCMKFTTENAVSFVEHN